MIDSVVKFKRIFLPYIIASIGTVCVYTFLTWLFFIKTTSIPVDGEIVNLLIPVIVPVIPMFVWIQPRIRLLELKTANPRNRPLGAYIILIWAIITVTAIIAQSYLITATGKLTTLDNIRDIKYVPKTMYYTVNQFYPNKNLTHTTVKFDVSGKGNVDYDMNIFWAVPVFDHPFPDTNNITLMRKSVNPKTLIIINDSLSNLTELKKLPADSIRMMKYVGPLMVMPRYGIAGKYGALAVMTMGYKITWKLPVLKMHPIAWFAFQYSKTIRNSLSKIEKQQSYKDFFETSVTDFKRKDLTKFVYMNRALTKWEWRNFDAAITTRGDVEYDEQPILTTVNESFDKRNGNTLQWLFGTYIIGSLIFLLAILFVPLKNNDQEN